MNMISKMGVKMNLRIITKYHAAYLEIRFLTKSISKPFGRATAIPPAWKLMNLSVENLKISICDLLCLTNCIN